MKNNDARHIAFEVLRSIDKDGAYSNLSLDASLNSAQSGSREAALASALTYGVLEREITLDYCLSQHLKQPLKKLKPQVLTVLRMGAYQLLFMDKIPARAAISESVALAKSSGCAFAAGLVNAVLRNVAEAGLTLPQNTDRVNRLSVEYSFPEWLVRLWIDAYGEENAAGVMASASGRPPLNVRVNTLKTTAQKLSGQLTDQGINVSSIPLCENALELSNCGSVENLREFKDGLFHVQDTSSQLCAGVAAPEGHGVMLDLCSAPGGKAFTAAQNMNNTGRIIACDVYEKRLGLIKNGAQRLGIDCIDTLVNDASVFNPDLPKADSVLCDVPCSGLGIVRRKPEIRCKKPSDIDKLPELQYHILCVALRYLKEHGRLVYSTCALNPAENEQVCLRFLSENPELRQVKLFPELERANGDSPFLTLMPHIHGTDGFFMAAFER